MKYLILLICSLAPLLRANCQQNRWPEKQNLLPTWNIDISWHKTTVLIFPAPIQSADRGDKYILAEKVKGVQNMLRVKAGQKNFEPSNLHVITTDGNVYAFAITYSESPAAYTIDMRNQEPYQPVQLKGVSLNSKEVAEYAGRVAGNLPFLSGARYHKYGIDFELDGIYIRQDVLFFQFHLKNKTQIGFDAASLRFYIRDNKKIKRTAVQEIEIEPIHIYQSGNPSSSKGQTIVIALPKFTMAENKHFIAEIMEAHGDRNPSCKVRQGKLLKARLLYN